MMTAERANAIMQGAPATEEEKREAQVFLKNTSSNGSNYEGGPAQAKQPTTPFEKQYFKMYGKMPEMTQEEALHPKIQPEIAADKTIGVLNNTPQASKENYSDVDNTKAVGATKEELDYMLQNGQISRAAYEKQIAALKTPEVQEEMAKGEKKADENDWDPSKRPDNFQLGSKVDAEPGDSDKDKNSKKRYNQSMMSIWDAYNNGLIDKETAGYFTVDALATLAKNLGRGIGNVGAQFSGGTIDQGHDESMWEQRKDKMFNTELQAESEKIKTFDNILKGYQTNRAATVNDMLNDFRAKADDTTLPETERKFYQVLSVQLAGAGLDGNTQIAAIGSGVWDDIKSKFGEWFGKEGK